MAGHQRNSITVKSSIKLLQCQRGVALVVALLFSLAIMALVTGTLYFVTQSTTLSGAGKVYATAEEAADGAVNVLKDSINLAIWGGDLATVFSEDDIDSLTAAIMNDGGSATATLNLPSGLSGNFQATVTVQRLYSVGLPGGRLEFARAAGGVAGTAIFFRITAVVTGPGNAYAENSALYRFAG